MEEESRILLFSLNRVERLRLLSECAAGAITTCHRPGTSATEVYFPSVLEAGKLRPRGGQRGFPLRSLSLAYRWPATDCVLSCSCIRVFLRPNLSLEGHPCTGLGPTLNDLISKTVSKGSPIPRYWGLGLQHEFWQDTNHPITNPSGTK